MNWSVGDRVEYESTNSRLIAHSLRNHKPAERWGPYCKVPPIFDRDGIVLEVVVVYPVARGWIRQDDGTTRPATEEELDLITRSYDAHLSQSMVRVNGTAWTRRDDR